LNRKTQTFLQIMPQSLQSKDSLLLLPSIVGKAPYSCQKGLDPTLLHSNFALFSSGDSQESKLLRDRLYRSKASPSCLAAMGNVPPEFPFDLSDVHSRAKRMAKNAQQRAQEKRQESQQSTSNSELTQSSQQSATAAPVAAEPITQQVRSVFIAFNYFRIQLSCCPNFYL
jgi:hypothetical protein